VVRLFDRVDAFRRPERFERFLLACEADKRGRGGRSDRSYPPAALLRRALAAARATPTEPLVAAGLNGPEFGAALARARAEAVAGVYAEASNASSH
jgi:tRNA nucleotidyltransferase (CCA-adding enzyme)